MILLAIDTARENCAVGLSIDGVVIVRERMIGKGHAEVLMPEIAALMAEADVKPTQIDRIAVSVGPGSFTGLRVGISAARGFGLVTGAPVIGISTLRAHACAARIERDRLGRPAKPILALMRARDDEFYMQAFNADAEPIEPPVVASLDSVVARVLEGGFDIAGAAIEHEGIAPPLHVRSAPDIRAVIALGLALDAAENPPRPLYVKPPDAQPQTRARIARQ
ncbi:tRNA (adenosine(37)-N6)-threonylcarbamoyltransferase complex dimerization subunit type 1 TsaB [Kaistia dalseonensis]|uniref:tRNA threonylcarbamoyladenosine biosynthesis protein TsaB n=1 Tax=Kaistia dalseonensis TaxID=410840 RepID=A0ABU0H595_9HYPH|nr:tRNA (adenosine(37)-N6)-threonylcarbamoyltransferase complex dimerization subunit type 1 TsaB [Kaistia dalseonensis]MCX5494899.1 tRNA (adenosine(37)-N6)-threonylcarbamoyltransferase complex dimerization subunit type 1 TsaB [Kaistia dalseonensis]MDQ0437480.1 tRNA threonylcarbamoyladenosine biosynthesis protein TsaB [Kaistia dalseonensis]